MSGERYMWGREAGDELSPQWTEDDIARIMAQSRLRGLVIMEPTGRINRIHITPKMTVERRPRMPRCHYLNVRLHPSVELKRSEARELLASLFQTLDLDAKPYHVGRREQVEVYCNKLEVGPT